MDKKVLDLQRQLQEKDLIIQNLKTKLDQLQGFKNQVSLALQNLPNGNEPASIQTCNTNIVEENPATQIECGICLLEVMGRKLAQYISN